jgi:hypothetical protein
MHDIVDTLLRRLRKHFELYSMMAAPDKRADFDALETLSTCDEFFFNCS